jgi:MFS family permease
MFGAGAAIGLVVGAWIANNFGWRTTYHTVIPAAIALTLLAAYYLKESPIRTPSRPDVFGATAFSVALVSFLIAMTEGSSWGWASPSILSLFGVALAFIMLFLFIESRVGDPMIHLAMLKKRNVFFTNITAFVAGLANFLVFQSVIYLLQAPAPIGCRCSLFQAGLVLAPGSLLMLVTAPLAGAIVTRRGAKLPLFMGAITLAASFCYFYVFHATQLQLLLGVMISFIGMGFMMVAMINIIIQSVEQAETGIATAMNTIFRTVGGVIGPTIVGVYLTQYTTLIPKITPHGLMMIPVPSNTAFDYIFLTALGIAIMGILVILLIKGRSDQVHIEGEEPVKRTGPEREGRVEHLSVQIPKWPHDADAAPRRVLARTSTPLGANDSPGLPGRELGTQPSSFPTTKLHGYGIELMVRDGDRTHGENDVTIRATSGHVTQLKAERSGMGDNEGESDGQIQKIIFTASDGSGGETQGAVAVGSTDAEGEHFNFIRFTPDKLHDCRIELVMKNGLPLHGGDAVTVTAVNADIIRLKAERFGEDGDQIQKIIFTASDGSGGETQGTVAMRSAAAKQHVVNVSMMYRSQM